MPKTVLKVSGVVFLIVALIHLARLVFKFDIIVAGHPIPLWANIIGLIIASALSLWSFDASKRL